MLTRPFISRFSKSLCHIFDSNPFKFRRRKTSTKCDDPLLKAFCACLYKKLCKQDYQEGNKVSIIGCGTVGMACAISLLTRRVTNRLMLYDINSNLCTGEAWDLMHGSVYLQDCCIQKTKCLDEVKDSRVVVVTAGARPKPGQTRLDVAQHTANIIKEVMPVLARNNPRAVFIVVANPADVMTWVACKVGKIPYERCISTGCQLDTNRFRLCIAEILGVSPRSVHGYVLGEHGNSSVPVWSTVTVGGIRLQSLIPAIGTEEDEMNWSKVHKAVVEAAYNITKCKGYTNWAIGLTVTDLISAIFEDSYRILSVSTNAQGICGIEDEVFLSLPCIINKWGLCGIMHPFLSDWEKCRMKKCVAELRNAQCSIKF